MEFWILLWKAVFVGAILIFAVMAVWVTVGGYHDIKRLFDRLRDLKHDED